MHDSWSGRTQASFLVAVLVLTSVLLALLFALPLGTRQDVACRETVCRENVLSASLEPRRFELSPVYLANGSLNPAKPDFGGPPRPQLDRAWAELLGDQAVRIRPEELGQFSGRRDLVRLADGSGDYYATLAVFHGLHCVRRLHHVVHRDAYYGGLSEAEQFRLERHTEHCLDWLRQAIQCAGDTTLLPLFWDDAHPLPVARDSGQHQCVRWAPLEKWAASRSFDPFERGLLVHPLLGYPYEEGKGDAIGIV